jgi:hypothetical protein
MATVQRTGDQVSVRFTTSEKLLGLVRDHTFPASSVTSAEVVEDAVHAARGLRSPGLGLPGRRLIGTWRRSGEKSLVSVRHGQPALRLRLTGQQFDTLLLGTDDAAALASELGPRRA